MERGWGSPLSLGAPGSTRIKGEPGRSRAGGASLLPRVKYPGLFGNTFFVMAMCGRELDRRVAISKGFYRSAGGHTVEREDGALH